MSENARGAPIFTCPMCHQKKTSVQRDLVCGKCVHQNTEIVRNSVIQNEVLNKQMRIQIDQIFDTCSLLNGTENIPQHNDFVFSTSTNSRNTDIPQPDESSVSQLALKLQKLELLNRKIKSNGLQKSREYLKKKNQTIEDKISALEQKLQKNQEMIELSQSRMLEDYSRKLEFMDKEIISLKYEAMRRVSKQTALKQYLSYKVIRENFFSTTSKAELNFCSRPVFTMQKFSDTQITTVNTFLEDLIRIQIVLFDLFKINDETLQLPYLEQLRKLLPERLFYDSVQKKIDIILQNEYIHMNGSIQPKDESDEPVINQNLSQISDFGKITIKDNTIQVPKSFRTMNLQRRSSVKEQESSDENVLPGAENPGSKKPKNAFVMVSQENKPAPDDLSPKSSAHTSPQGANILGQGVKTDTKSSQTGKAKNDWAGKKIVIVPHRILPKPFAKLRPSEYLKFVSIVVKILVTYNAFLAKVLGKGMDSDKEIHGLSGVRQGQKEGDTDVKSGTFIYDFREIMLKVSNLDGCFQQRAEIQNQNHDSLVYDSGITHLIDASQLTNGEDVQTMRESWASDTGISVPKMPLPNFQKIRSFYTKLVSKTLGSEQTPEPQSASDNVIYGMVSETTPTAGLRGKDTSEIEGTREDDPGVKVINDQESAGYDLKEILRKVHDLISGKTISGKNGTRDGNNRLTNLDRLGARSVMQQSRAHLEDWDVVSKMF